MADIETDEERAAKSAALHAYQRGTIPSNDLQTYAAGYMAGQEAGYQRSVDEYEHQIATLRADAEHIRQITSRIHARICAIADQMSSIHRPARCVTWNDLYRVANDLRQDVTGSTIGEWTGLATPAAPDATQESR